MTRAECEAKLMEHLEAMVAILHEYNPKSTYLYASWSEDAERSYFVINNEYFDLESPDNKLPICCYKIGGGELVSETI